MTDQTLPFRAEHIGSLLRPPAIHTLRQQVEAGEATLEELKATEDKFIKEAIAFQESVGLQSITDGEYRRGYYFGNFPEAVSGFTQMTAELDFLDEHGQKMKYTSPVVTDKLQRERGIATDDFKYVQALTNRTPKVTMPSPCSQHYFRYREDISRDVYPDIDEFFTDVASIYQAELAELAELGATYIQLDDTTFTLFCDPKWRSRFAARGYDPAQFIDKYVDWINDSIANKPADMTIALHQCRGNNQGEWLFSGGYEAIAARIFPRLHIDSFLLEYDSDRAGGFEPLRFMPKEKFVVLGLISSKVANRESAEDLMRRIDEAEKYFSRDQLGISPQCGFASTAPGNPLSEDEQWQKLALAVEVAARAW